MQEQRASSIGACAALCGVARSVKERCAAEGCRGRPAQVVPKALRHISAGRRRQLRAIDCEAQADTGTQALRRVSCPVLSQVSQHVVGYLQQSAPVAAAGAASQSEEREAAAILTDMLRKCGGEQVVSVTHLCVRNHPSVIVG